MSGMTDRSYIPTSLHPYLTSLPCGRWRNRCIPVCVINDPVVKVHSGRPSVRFRVDPDRVNAAVLDHLLDPVLARQADELSHVILFHPGVKTSERGDRHEPPA